MSGMSAASAERAEIPLSYLDVFARHAYIIVAVFKCGENTT
jgi:hypothetical protein